MNTDPAAKTILCYGDSNTRGQTPDRTGRRRSADIRWTGVLQQNLGVGYSIIEASHQALGDFLAQQIRDLA
jgi:lysophospholipase L1-like esterase